MNLINYVYGAAALGFAALVPLYAQERYDIAPLGAGTLLTARAVGMIAVAGAADDGAAADRLPAADDRRVRDTGRRPGDDGGHAAAARPYAWLAIGAAVTGLGMGLSVPAANNASLQLAPDQVAAIAGLRGMFRQAGAITAVSVTTAVIARSAAPRPGPGARVPRVRGAAAAHAAAGAAGARPPRQLVTRGQHLRCPGVATGPFRINAFLSVSWPMSRLDALRHPRLSHLRGEESRAS